jgi:hypothetical protein
MARSILCFWAVQELGINQTQLGRMFRNSQPAVGMAVSRSEWLGKLHNFWLNE